MIENLFDDVLAAVMLDPTRDANAIDTKVSGYTNDAADPDGLDSRGWGVTSVITVEIVYLRTTAVS